MTMPEPPHSFIGGIDSIIPGLLRFSHVAMATTFEICIVHEDKRYAQQAAEAAFAEVDRLEWQFSRFIENSDIAQIAALKAHQSLQLGMDSFQCLRLCERFCRETGGAFDVTAGALMNCWFDKNKALRSPSKEELDAARRRTGCGVFRLNEEKLCIEVMTDNIQIDLGAVGKGYAVDKIAELLREWDINKVLINGGSSSILALDAPDKLPGWPVTLSAPGVGVVTKIHLKNRALSGSGLQKGRHIMDVRTGRPVENKLAAWVCVKDAAADALSTAFMVMDIADIERYCRQHTDVQAKILLSGEKKPLSYGDWQSLSGNSTPDDS